MLEIFLQLKIPTRNLDIKSILVLGFKVKKYNENKLVDIENLKTTT